jgi:hypothetical protein
VFVVNPLFHSNRGKAHGGGTWPEFLARERFGEHVIMDGPWENLCRRCGRCCFEKIQFEDEIFYTDVPCKFLDSETHLCTVYADRTRQKPGCVAITPEIARMGLLPADCPYVAHLEDYRAPRMWEEK